MSDESEDTEPTNSSETSAHEDKLDMGGSEQDDDSWMAGSTNNDKLSENNNSPDQANAEEINWYEAKTGSGDASESGAEPDANSSTKAHPQTQEPEAAGEGSLGPPQTSVLDGGNQDEWSKLIAEGNDEPGEFFKLETRTRLAALKDKNLPHWINLRNRIKKECPSVPIRGLDKAIDQLLGSKEGDLQGQALGWDNPEPWPEAVKGADLLSEISTFIRRYVHMSDTAADALALWVVHTWLHDRLEISTFLNVTSATKRCGKTLLMEVLATLVRCPLDVSGQITSAALFRTIELHKPTLMLDEADTYFGKDPELRGIFNGSQRRGSARVIRCVGEDHEPRSFNTWCPKAISGIGSLPDTVMDRSLVIRLERRPSNSGDLPQWRDRNKRDIEDIRRKIAQWISDDADLILARRNDVAFPPGLHDRERDAWEPLLTIADHAGGTWSGENGRAWRAAEAISANTEDQTDAREKLLADIHKVFREAGMPPTLPTTFILEKLNSMEDRPWPEWKLGKAFSPRQLASLLKPFGITPGTIRVESSVTGRETAKGYKRSTFEKAWNNYGIGDTPSLSVTTSQPLSDNGYSDSPSVTNQDPVTDTKSRAPQAANGCDGVTDTPNKIPPEVRAFELSEWEAKAQRRAASGRTDTSQSDAT